MSNCICSGNHDNWDDHSDYCPVYMKGHIKELEIAVREVGILNAERLRDISDLKTQLAESDHALDCMTSSAGELQDVCDKLEKQLVTEREDFQNVSASYVRAESQLEAVKRELKMYKQKYPHFYKEELAEFDRQDEASREHE